MMTSTVWFAFNSLGGFLLAALVIQTHAYQLNDSFVSNERRLYKYLLEDYEKSVRPVKHESDTVQLELDYEVNFVEDLEEVNQALYTTGWLRMTWTDFQLSWNTQDFGGVDSIRIPASELWIPDVTVVNSLNVESSVPLQQTMALVVDDGTVMWIVPVSLRTLCPTDLTWFPYDQHNCPIHIMPWTYPEQMVNLSKWKMEMGDELSRPIAGYNPEWETTQGVATRVSRTYPCCPENFVYVTFYINMKRITSFATHLFLAPSVTLGIIIPSIFVLPPSSREKMMMGAGVLIAHVLLLGELIKYVPSEHPTVPLMGQFFLANIVLVALSLAISAVVINFWSRNQTRNFGPPAILRYACLNSCLMRILCVDFSDYEDLSIQQHYATFDAESQPGSLEVMSDLTSRMTSDDRVRIVTDHQRSEARADWRRLAIVIDRLFLVLYLLVTVALSLAYIGYL
jgi:hypothetical protein